MQKAQEDKQRWQDEAAKLSQEIAQQQKLVDQWKGEYIPPHHPCLLSIPIHAAHAVPSCSCCDDCAACSVLRTSGQRQPGSLRVCSCWEVCPVL